MNGKARLKELLLQVDARAMKPIIIHPLSGLFGCALSGLVVLATSATRSPTIPQTPSMACRELPALQVLGIPAPKDMLVILQENGPFTVPTGKILVVTALGQRGSLYESPTLLVDGIEQFHASHLYNTAAPVLSMLEVPAPGLMVPGGSVVTFSGSSNARALGYLGDA